MSEYEFCPGKTLAYCGKQLCRDGLTELSNAITTATARAEKAEGLIKTRMDEPNLNSLVKKLRLENKALQKDVEAATARAEEAESQLAEEQGALEQRDEWVAKAEKEREAAEKRVAELENDAKSREEHLAEEVCTSELLKAKCAALEKAEARLKAAEVVVREAKLIEIGWWRGYRKDSAYHRLKNALKALTAYRKEQSDG